MYESPSLRWESVVHLTAESSLGHPGSRTEALGLVQQHPYIQGVGPSTKPETEMETTGGVLRGLGPGSWGKRQTTSVVVPAAYSRWEGGKEEMDFFEHLP